MNIRTCSEQLKSKLFKSRLESHENCMGGCAVDTFCKHFVSICVSCISNTYAPPELPQIASLWANSGVEIYDKSSTIL